MRGVPRSLQEGFSGTRDGSPRPARLPGRMARGEGKRPGRGVLPFLSSSISAPATERKSDATCAVPAGAVAGESPCDPAGTLISASPAGPTRTPGDRRTPYAPESIRANLRFRRTGATIRPPGTARWAGVRLFAGRGGQKPGAGPWELAVRIRRQAHASRAAAESELGPANRSQRRRRTAGTTGTRRRAEPTQGLRPREARALPVRAALPPPWASSERLAEVRVARPTNRYPMSFPSPASQGRHHTGNSIVARNPREGRPICQAYFETSRPPELALEQGGARLRVPIDARRSAVGPIRSLGDSMQRARRMVDRRTATATHDGHARGWSREDRAIVEIGRDFRLHGSRRQPEGCAEDRPRSQRDSGSTRHRNSTTRFRIPGKSD